MIIHSTVSSVEVPWTHRSTSIAASVSCAKTIPPSAASYMARGLLGRASEASESANARLCQTPGVSGLKEWVSEVTWLAATV